MNFEKAVHLSSAHPPFDVRIFEKECRSLRAAGYDVVFVVPNSVDEVRDGVQIRRAGDRPRSRLERFTSTQWRVYRKALKEKGDIYHFHDPDLIFVGLILKLHGKRVIYDVHENYRNVVLSREWLPRSFRRFVSYAVAAIEWVAGKVFDGIVSAVPAIARLFPETKNTTVCNFPDARWAGTRESTVGQRETRRGSVVYVGGISRLRGIETMIEAIEQVPEALHPELVVAGEFSKDLKEALSVKPGWNRTTILDWQTRAQVASLLRESQVGICVLHPTPNHIESFPIKLFEYMAFGLPVVVSNFPLWHDIVIDSNCGLLVNPMDPKAIADAIAWLLAHPCEAAEMGHNGQRAVMKRYNWESEAARLVAAYANVLPARRLLNLHRPASTQSESALPKRPESKMDAGTFRDSGSKTGIEAE